MCSWAHIHVCIHTPANTVPLREEAVDIGQERYGAADGFKGQHHYSRHTPTHTLQLGGMGAGHQRERQHCAPEL